MLIIFQILKKLCLIYASDTCLNSRDSEAASKNCSKKKKILCDIEIDHLQISILVKLLYTYSSTKDKLILKYFIRKMIWKSTSP